MHKPYYQIIAANGTPQGRHLDQRVAIRKALSRNTRYGEKNRVVCIEAISETCNMSYEVWHPDHAV